MLKRSWLVLGLAMARLLAAQDMQAAVRITGAVRESLTLSAGDLAKMPRAAVRSRNTGVETVYEGVWLHEVLKRAGVPQGSELRGEAMYSPSRWGSWIVPSSTMRSCWPTRRTGKHCPERSAGSGWWRRKTNRECDRCGCYPDWKSYS